MKKVALVFALAVFVPSLLLAWLAFRSVRDQQIVLERQQALLYQGITDTVAREVNSFLADRQREFRLQVESILGAAPITRVRQDFDEQVRQAWPLAGVGFVVSMEGVLFSPPALGRLEARQFLKENQLFLCSREPAEVYLPQVKGAYNNAQQSPASQGGEDKLVQQGSTEQETAKNSFPQKMQKRSIAPQKETTEEALAQSQVTVAEFRQLIGEEREGTVARFLQNKLNLMFWYRSPRQERLVFGVLLDLPRTLAQLRSQMIRQGAQDPALQRDLCVALLDEKGKPLQLSLEGFQADWKHPFVATELGEALPHWEAAVYLRHPEQLSQAARTLKVTLGLIISLLMLAIGVGSILIVNDLRRQLTLARQKTDFVSNVSHELKTPLTSIRMFSELLAEGRVTEPERQKTYLMIIGAETARLTRLINNVLDFSRLERGEKKYHFETCDFLGLVRGILETYRPHLEAAGFVVEAELPEGQSPVQGDRDALAQVVVNLLSNAEKYSGENKWIGLRLETGSAPEPQVELQVLDEGMGVPPGCEEKIFEQFYRAHDSLGSGIQGSGLGLTLARQIARAHGGEVRYAPRPGGRGSCFSVWLPGSSRRGKEKG